MIIVQKLNPFTMRPAFFLAIIFILTSSCESPIVGDLVVEDVNIIDVENGETLQHQDLVITGNKITNIVRHGTRKISSPVVIDGKGKFLIPGLWDMHAHMMRNKWYESQMPLMRANGITGFREMWGDLRIVNETRQKIHRDSLPYFRYIASGHILDGRKPFWKGSISVADVDYAYQVVDSLKNAGSDFIKVYSFLDPKVFNAIAKRSKELSIPFAGHVPHTVRLPEASARGMASMEHLYGFLTEACSESDSAFALMQRSVAAFNAGDMKERKRLSSIYHSLVLENFSLPKLQSVCDVLKQNNTHIVPTLATLKGIYFINDSAFTNDERKRYLSDETLEYWREVEVDDMKSNTEQDWSDKKRRWEVEQLIMKMLISEKVTIMAGTDCDNPYAFPGFSLHDELKMFVNLGMTPLDALRSATIVPAKFMNMTDSIGSIAQGKLADLVLLKANPLDDISNTTAIEAVVANGKLYDRTYISSILD